jgi:perosamine synthetase
MVPAAAGGMIRLMVPDVGDEEIEAVARVLRSGHLVQGAQVTVFEAALAQRAGVREVVAVSSGTAALHLSLLALGIGPGDQVIVPAYTWPATANVVVLAGADPVFVDIEPVTFGIDPGELERALQAQGRVRAIMPVHAFGGMADMTAIADVARRWNVPIVEDAACALGASLSGTSAGAWGVLGCFSFHPRKVITTGEGGAVATNSPELGQRLRMLRNHGLDPSAPTPRFSIPGFNVRLTEFQAALGTSQLSRLDGILTTRRALADAYEAGFHGTPVVTPRSLGPKSHAFQSYVVLLPPDCNRDRMIALLKTKGIETTIGTYHVPSTQYYMDRFSLPLGTFRITDDVSARALTLPLHRGLDGQSVSRIVEVVLSQLA